MSVVGGSLKALFKKRYPLDPKLIWGKSKVRYTLN